MNSSASKLSLIQGISIGIGSIIGSGVLFLPSMTLKMAGFDALLGWVLIIVLCLPGLYFLREMVENSKENEGIAGFISLGLGKDLGNAIPILLLGTVTIGMPSAAIVAGRYVQALIPNHPQISNIVPFIMILITIYVTLKGIKTSAILNTIVTVLLLTVGAALFFKTSTSVAEYKIPTFNYDLKNILNSAVLAFWAFAGFENLTFLSSNFVNPRRDLLISAGVAIFLCGLLYVGLTLNISLLISQDRIDSSLGLLQLGDYVQPISISKLLIALFALFAVMINLLSWTAGISNAVVSSSSKGMLPTSLSKLDNHIPKNATIALGVAFLISTSVGIFSSDIFDSMLALVSSNFLVLYLLSIISYAKFTSSIAKKIIASILSVLIIVVLLSYKLLLIYPTILIILSILYSKFSSSKRVPNEA